MTDIEIELKPSASGGETPSPQAAAEGTAEPAPETDAAGPAEPQTPSEAPRYLIDGEPVDDEYAVLDHPKLKPHMERHERRLEESLRTQYEEQVKQATQRWESTNVHNALSTELGRITANLADGDLEGTDKVLARVERLAEPYLEPYRQALRSEGALGMSNSFLAELSKSLPRRERDEFDDMVKTRREFSWADAVAERDRLKFGSKEAELKRELQAKDDIIEKMKAEGRTGQGPNLAQSASGGRGINNIDDADREYAAGRLSHEAYKEARERFGVRSR